MCKDSRSRWLKPDTKFSKLENFPYKNVTLGSDKHPFLQPENGDTVWANPGSLGIKSPHRGKSRQSTVDSGEITRPCGCSCRGTGRGMLQNVEKAKKTRRSEVGGRGLAESEGRLGNDGEAKEGAGGKGEERGLRGPKLFGRLPEGLEGERLRGKQGRKV